MSRKKFWRRTFWKPKDTCQYLRDCHHGNTNVPFLKLTIKLLSRLVNLQPRCNLTDNFTTLIVLVSYFMQRTQDTFGQYNLFSSLKHLFKSKNMQLLWFGNAIKLHLLCNFHAIKLSSNGAFALTVVRSY